MTDTGESRYLKNASVRRDADGHYYLSIEAGGLRAMFLLSEKKQWADESGKVVKDNDDSIERRALVAWLAEQDQ
jgi:hypothetical protein